MKYRIYCGIQETFNDGKDYYVKNYKKTYIVNKQDNKDPLGKLIVKTIIKKDDLNVIDYSVALDPNWDLIFYVRNTRYTVIRYHVYKIQ